MPFFLWLTSSHTHTKKVLVFHFMYIYYFFLHSSVNGHLGWSLILTIINNAVINIGVHKSFQTSILVFFGYIPRIGVSGSYGILLLVFTRNLLTVFHTGCINFHSHPRCTRVLFSPYPCQLLLFVALFYDRHSDISLMISNTEHLFMCLSAICISSLEKESIQLFLPFFFFICVVFW